MAQKTITRLGFYRRVLRQLAARDTERVFSHELAALSGTTAAQVRRDLMMIGYEGKPTKGYDVRGLADSIGDFLDSPEGMGVALVGVGNVGRAVIGYFSDRHAKLAIVAAFDKDVYKVGRLIGGCPCYPITELSRVVREAGILVAVIAVPATEAQDAADKLVAAGVRGLLNFAPVSLKVPPFVFVESLDITISLEKVAYFARQKESEADGKP